jgi:PhnB protein
MAQLNPYLHFNGNCREAMTFYQACFGGELTLQTVGESPMAEHMPSEMHEQALHAMLTTDGLVFMASDMLSSEEVVRGNGTRLCLVCTSRQEIETLFARLAEGGQIEHSLEETFFGTYGDLTDRFGVGWMLQFSPTQHNNVI